MLLLLFHYYYHPLMACITDINYYYVWYLLVSGPSFSAISPEMIGFQPTSL